MHDSALKGSFFLQCVVAIKGKYPTLVRQYPLERHISVCKKGDTYCKAKQAGQYTMVVIFNLPSRTVADQCVQDIHRGKISKYFLNVMTPISFNQPEVKLG